MTATDIGQIEVSDDDADLWRGRVEDSRDGDAPRDENLRWRRQAPSRMFFRRRSGRIGQKVLVQLRRRVFRHFQRLDVAFHDRYTSGRVVSRSTNDVEAIQDMLETGFDGLITAALTLVGTAILLVTLDVRLGLMCLAAFPVLVVLIWWFRDESAKPYRK